MRLYRLYISVFLMFMAFAINASADIQVSDVTYKNGLLKIEYSNPETIQSRILVIEYDKDGRLLSTNSNVVENGSVDKRLYIQMDKDTTMAVIYSCSDVSGIKKLGEYEINKVEDEIIISEYSDIYDECAIPINYIGGLKKGYYDESGNLIENNKGYVSELFHAEGITVSVETYYHVYELDVLRQTADGRYSIIHTGTDVYKMKENDCAFMVVMSDNSEITDQSINMINQNISLKCDVNINEAKSGNLIELKRIETELTDFSIPFTLWDKDEKNNSYECWPFSNSWYDESDDSVNVIYTAGSDHLSYIGKFAIYFRKIYSDNTISPAIPVVKSDDIGYNAFSANILSDGTYIAAIYDQDNGIMYRYTSTDKGKSWNGQRMSFDENPNLEVISITGMKENTGNTVIAFAKMSDKTFRIIRSTDKGLTWSYITDSIDDKIQALEGAFVKLSGERLVCIMRGVEGQPPYKSQASTYMIKSADNGNTWSEMIELKGMDATCNPVSALYHEDSKTVEMLYGSRYAREDYCGSINQMVVSENDLWNGNLSNTTEVRLYRAPASRDFGYFTMSKTRDGIVKAYFYSGDSGYANIYCMMGKCDC